jgi:hypothetical protein
MRLLLRLYPRPWRRRYQREVEAVLLEMPRGPRVAWDLLRGALDAHLHPQLPGRRGHWPVAAAVATGAIAIAAAVALVLSHGWIWLGGIAAVVVLLLLLRWVRRPWQRPPGRARRGGGPPDDGDRGAGVGARPRPGRPPALAAAVDEPREWGDAG